MTSAFITIASCALHLDYSITTELKKTPLTMIVKLGFINIEFTEQCTTPS